MIEFPFVAICYTIDGYPRWQSRKHTKRSTDGKVILCCPPQPILLSLPVLPVSMICTCVYVHGPQICSVFNIYVVRTLQYQPSIYCTVIHCGSCPRVNSIRPNYIDLVMVVINGFGNSSIQYRPLANDELNMRTYRPKRSRLLLSEGLNCCCFETPTAYWYN